jgi:Flp pilus assembly protein TadG
MSPYVRLSRFCGGKSRRTRRDAATAAELAIVLPLLVGFGIAGVDFGRFAYVSIAVENAVRVGAERGASRSFTSYTYPAWKADVEQRMGQELADINSGLVDGLQISVAAEPQPDGLPRITVAAQCTFRTAIRWPFWPEAVLIRRAISMRQFR